MYVEVVYLITIDISDSCLPAHIGGVEDLVIEEHFFR